MPVLRQERTYIITTWPDSVPTSRDLSIFLHALHQLCAFEEPAHLDALHVAVEAALAQEGLDLVPVHAALCFTNAEWGWFAKPFSLNGVWVKWATKLTELVLDWNAIPDTEIDRLARVVNAKLPSAA